MLRGPWYLRTSPLSQLYVYLLLAFDQFHADLWISLSLHYWPSDIAWTLIFQVISTVGASDITSIMIYGANLVWTLICEDISTVGHQIPILRGPWHVRTSPLSEMRHYVHFWCQFVWPSFGAISTVDILMTFLTDKTSLSLSFIYIHHNFKTIHYIVILEIMRPRT